MGGTAIKGSFILKIKDSYNEESFEKLAGEIEGELKEDIENINFFLKNSVDMKLKFSYFTFPHQLMRLILLEQVYRWFAISNNIKYHK